MTFYGVKDSLGRNLEKHLLFGVVLPMFGFYEQVYLLK